MPDTPPRYYMPVPLPCARCADIDQLWLIDNWQPLCLRCAVAALPHPVLYEALAERAARTRVIRHPLPRFYVSRAAA